MHIFHARYRALIILAFLAGMANEAMAAEARFFSLNGSRNLPQTAKFGGKSDFFSLSGYRQAGAPSDASIAARKEDGAVKEKRFELASLSPATRTQPLFSAEPEISPGLPETVLSPAQKQEGEKTESLSWPLPESAAERISSGYGQRIHPITGLNSFHDGVDIVAAPGTKVLATVDGVVEEAGRKAGLGNYVRLTHAGGLTSTYGHLASIHVKAGQKVSKGTLVGRLGSTGLSTGPHLHYAMKKDGVSVNPMPYLSPSEPFNSVEVAQKAD